MRDPDNNKGCIRQPLLEVDASCCPPDILHMKKGIISKLVNQLVNWCVVQKRETQLLDEMKRHKIHFRYGGTVRHNSFYIEWPKPLICLIDHLSPIYNEGGGY